MKYVENIAAIAHLQPDYMGFIFYKNSARYFDGLIPEIPKSIKKTGVFVDSDLKTVLETVKQYDLQAVQLHGTETPELCLEIRRNTNVEIIKTFSIDAAFDFTLLQDYETACDYYLFDTKGKFPGGNGFAFDWKILERYPSDKPYFLSGGIGPEDSTAILQSGLSPYAIDINSKFETVPGLKDPHLCEQVVLKIRNNEN
ncbi:phosphoribosylanthranilate isomerase [Flavobacterium cerinum]|uniref:N-(5'-phosphoribosyl)anthranilate isomerase n=1 Tax=Flavobacterium cerinum TaxID=2502784 RepID=A0ABY5IN64_9FLAO|nr:phosphoribosylanthranilate isomerase [Flavobacterium cerinum]UUC44230.1 phosphoribosylanthranilate isomerase [Flavobacterium cerinum]